MTAYVPYLIFETETSFKESTAKFIGRDLQAISDVIILDRGKTDGIDIGTVLISHKGLVGHVILAGRTHAKVLLISDIKARVSAMVQETRDVGIIEGTPTTLLRLKNVTMDATMKIGDVVITSGFGDIFPKGIPIGVIEMIGTEPSNLYLYALVRPFVNFFEARRSFMLEERLVMRDLSLVLSLLFSIHLFPVFSRFQKQLIFFYPLSRNVTTGKP